MNYLDGVAAALLDNDATVITEYGFFLLGYKLLQQGEWQGEPLKRLPLGWDQPRVRRAIGRMEARQVLAPDVDFASGVWRIVHSTRTGSAEEVACAVDPFCYVSHLSAMQRYGLTDRSPEALHLTTPARLVWSRLRQHRMQEDLGGQPDQETPPLHRIGFKGSIRRRPVVVHETGHPAMPAPIRGERTRITSIGRTFVDMLSEPALCGGIRHVIEIWTRDAEQWAPQIIEEVERTDAKIVKVRAGYLLSEVLGVEDGRVEGWDRFAQRGGSRKLDPDAPYAPTFSERWMISLNA